jgi:hypothetical protein
MPSRLVFSCVESFDRAEEDVSAVAAAEDEHHAAKGAARASPSFLLHHFLPLACFCLLRVVAFDSDEVLTCSRDDEY